jgi:NAD(P)-dependent dehydrogenase (short-subunit alcohol dehydrogenase family)
VRFQGWTVIVTGGGYGIGRAIALDFGRGGANVMLAARSRDKLEAVAAELRALGTQPRVWEMSVADESAVAAMVREAHDRTGRLDVLVNNSGIAGPTRLARDITPEEWRETLEVNLTGAFLCAKHAAGFMIERRRGAIVNIASVAARIGYPLRTPYAASKWGLLGLNHSLAAELGPYGIRVNAVLPGPTEGDRMRRVIAARAQAEGKTAEETERWFTRDLPLGRMAKEDEVAAAVTFLASDAAAGITGQTINVDAGYRMQ